MFRKDVWGTPEVHPSAAADILAGLQFPDPPHALHISLMIGIFTEQGMRSITTAWCL